MAPAPPETDNPILVWIRKRKVLAALLGTVAIVSATLKAPVEILDNAQKLTGFVADLFRTSAVTKDDSYASFRLGNRVSAVGLIDQKDQGAVANARNNVSIQLSILQLPLNFKDSDFGIVDANVMPLDAEQLAVAVKRFKGEDAARMFLFGYWLNVANAEFWKVKFGENPIGLQLMIQDHLVKNLPNGISPFVTAAFDKGSVNTDVLMNDLTAYDKACGDKISRGP